ncbi:MAG: hypothetical protein LM591_01685 [Candidatus Korarchaeum sp.]|jgi:hypothetical protein|nr:hypothetical protein [Candidatus Korarchaeum sp.]
MGGKVSGYLLSSLKEYFGEEKGEKIAEILSRSNIRCFDDLSTDIPDSLIELMEVSKSSFRSFLEEYGPQAIAKLKERVEDLSSKVKQLETQISWAKERIQQSIDFRSSTSLKMMRELDVTIGILSSLVSSIQICCEKSSEIDERKAEIYSGILNEAVERLRRASDFDEEFSDQLKETASSLERMIEILRELRAGDLLDLLNYTLSMLSDIKRTKMRLDLDKNSLIFENILLKSKIISLLCSKFNP